MFFRTLHQMFNNDGMMYPQLINTKTSVGELHDNLYMQHMTGKDFKRLRDFIESRSGIKLAESKKDMLEGRIRKRLRYFGMHSFAEYCRYIFSPEGMAHELEHMINAVTTNKTDFFRESWHFEYLIKTALPELIGEQKLINKTFYFWSAGCSTGEEPYTLAIFLNELAENCPGFRYSILATDICTEALEKAEAAIYDEENIKPIPLALRKKYLLRGKDHSSNLVRIVPEVRERVEFRRINLMDNDFGINDPVDVIFCRNVIIYFEKSTQEKVVGKFCQHLIPGGYLFMGHSETLNNLNVPLAYASATVYRKH